MPDARPAYTEVRDFLSRPSGVTILLGAGASLSSGGATSLGIARDVLRSVGRLPAAIESSDDAVMDEFLQYLLHLQGPVRADYLRKYFRALFPNIGYVYLARLIERAFRKESLRAVLTTNFDYLLEAAIGRWSGLLPARDFGVHVLGATAGPLAPLVSDHRRLTILKVYGDYYADTLRFTAEETKRFPADIATFLQERLRTPLLVVGYSARDGLGDLLVDDSTKDVPVWWVNPTSPLERGNAYRAAVEAFLERRNGAVYVHSRVFSGASHGDFDYFMSTLFAEVAGSSERDELEQRYMPDVLEGRPDPEPFDGARRKLSVLISAFGGSGAKTPWDRMAQSAKLPRAQLTVLMKSARELNPRYEFTVDGDGVLMSERTPSHAEKLRLDSEQKIAIGREAAGLVETGSLVLIDGGTTTLEVARRLVSRCREEADFTVTLVTNAVEIARLVRQGNRQLVVWFVGGEIRAESLDTMGAPAAKALEDLCGRVSSRPPEICFVGATRITLDGFCVRTPFEKEVKTTMLTLAERKIVVADRSKFAGAPGTGIPFYPLSLDVTIVTNETEEPLYDFPARVREILFAPVL